MASRRCACIPVGGAEAIYGRTGLLTHTYLLGPNGDSNGCISFKDYEAFLRAYKAGKVRRMIVVASLDNPQFDLRSPGSRAGRSVPRVPTGSPPRLNCAHRRRPLPLVLQRVARLAHQFVGAFVKFVARVTLHPMPAHGVEAARGVEPLP